MISVILPTYERVDAVLCCLEALKNQTFKGSWELVIVDDSKSNAIREAIWPPSTDCPFWYFRSSPPRTGSFTGGRARNIGVANARGDLMLFVDQDVLLAPDCLENYWKAYNKYGDNVVYVGLYHWLKPLDFGPEDIAADGFDFKALLAAGIGLANPPAFKQLPLEGDPGLLGIDHRQKDFGGFDKLVDDAALGTHGGNLAYPRKLFIELGGFDEMINKHGGEDADLGLTALRHGAKFLLWAAIWGVHRWHSRDQKKNEAEVQLNIQYIDKKHGLGPYAEAKKFAEMDARDWGDEAHYYKAVGGVAMQAMGHATVWICRDGHRLGLPNPGAFTRLGFAPEDVLKVPANALEQYEREGTANG